MYFILSKLLIIFIHPLTWVLVLLLIAVLNRSEKWRKICAIASLILLIIFTNGFLYHRFASHWDYPEVSLNSVPNGGTVILLGGFANEDKYGNGYFNVSADRFLATLKLKDNGKASRILLTGGNSSLIPTAFREGNWVKGQFKNYGVSDSIVVIETASRNSFENAANSKKLIDNLHLPAPYILVTSAFHMRRSVVIFRKTGIPVIAFPCNYIAGRERFTLNEFIPQADVLDGWNYYLKEIIGYWSAKLKR